MLRLQVAKESPHCFGNEGQGSGRVLGVGPQRAKGTCPRLSPHDHDNTNLSGAY